MPGAPDRMDHLLAMAGIALSDLDDHVVMEHAFHGHVHVEDIGCHHLEQRQEDALRGLAEVGILLGRPADKRCRIDGILAVGDGGDVEDRVLIRLGIIARMVPERSFDPPFTRLHIPFEHELGLGRNPHIDGLALHDLKRPLSAGNPRTQILRSPAAAGR